MLGIGLRAHRDDPMPARAAVLGRPRRRRLRRPGVLSQVVGDPGAKLPGGERARPSGWSLRVRGRRFVAAAIERHGVRRRQA
jgi:hypothetical protein